MARKINILWTQSGCIKCEDYRNAGLYDKITNLKEYSLEETEGLALSCFFEMWLKGDSIETPCLYIGRDMFGDSDAIRVSGNRVKNTLETFREGIKRI